MTPLGALRFADPTAFRARLRSILTDAGSITGAAEAIGVDRKTVQRWIAADPSLTLGVELRGAGRPSEKRKPPPDP